MMDLDPSFHMCNPKNISNHVTFLKHSLSFHYTIIEVQVIGIIFNFSIICAFSNIEEMSLEVFSVY